MAIDRARIDEIRSRYADLAQVMDERVTRRWAAGEAKSLGHGGIAAVTEATGILGKRIRYGIRTWRRCSGVRRVRRHDSSAFDAPAPGASC